MKKLLLIGILVIQASEAPAADLPLKAPPASPSAPRFTWSACYLGAHLGGGWARKDVSDPAQLVQDAFAGTAVTTGSTTANVAATGVVGGGQFGCDYQFASNWVAGIEGAASSSNLRGSAVVGLPLGSFGDHARLTGSTDFIPSVTGRIGFALDRFLFYAKGGVAWAEDKYTIAGIFQGTGFDFEGLDMRTGWTAGAGMEWAFYRHWSARVEYDYYQFGTASIPMSDPINVLSGSITAKQNIQTVKAALSFRFWSNSN